MSSIEKYENQQLVQKMAYYDSPQIPQEEQAPNLVMPILRRWYIVLAVAVLITICAIPVIWLLKKPVYEVQGAIRVAPVRTNILSGEADKGEIGQLENFMNTQARIITSNQIVQRVADELANKNLAFFNNQQKDIMVKIKEVIDGQKLGTEPADVLKRAISNGTITAAPARKTEHIAVTMLGRNPNEAKQIVDSFIRAYGAVVDDKLNDEEYKKLDLLEEEQDALLLKIKDLRDNIRALAQEYGSKSLDKIQEMKRERLKMLLSEVTRYEALALQAEARVKVLRGTIDEQKSNQPEKADITDDEQLIIESDPQREEYVNSDRAVSELAVRISQLEQKLIEAKQILAPSNPDLKLRIDTIEALKVDLDERKKEAAGRYDSLKLLQAANTEEQKIAEAQIRLTNAEAELDLNQELKSQFQQLFTEEDVETIQVGRKQLDIDDFQDELALTKETYDQIRRRIKELDMERKGEPRISKAYDAEIVNIRDKRIKLSLAAVFGSFAAGGFIAFLLSKMDSSLYTPEDITKRVGVRIIGTTTRSDYLDPKKLPEQLTGDYQTIRANLGMLNGGGIPKKLVVTSPGMREGKTTFAINLATSMAKSGKKVLLIDADLRKPDIHRLMRLKKNSKGLQDIIAGKEFESIVQRIEVAGFDVITAEGNNSLDAFETLSSSRLALFLHTVSDKYDHIVIDTPPVLAFPDALVLAKMSDGVVLASLAGQTDQNDLRETIDRLSQIKVKVLGTILNSVSVNYSYNRYSYGYYEDRAGKRKNRRNRKNVLMLPKESGKGK